MPASSQACSTVAPAGTSTSMPSTVTLGHARLLRRHRHAHLPRLVRARSGVPSRGRKWRIRPWIGQAPPSPSAQMVWPSTCLVTSSSMSISSIAASPVDHALHHAPHPARAFAAGRALAAALVLVEGRQAGDRADDVGRLVHDDHRRGAEARAMLAQRVEIHQHVVADRLRAPAAPTNRRGSPPADCPSRRERRRRMLLDQLAQRDAHLLLDVARLVHVALRCRTAWCPVFFGRPKPANHAAPRRRIVGATAMLSTLFTVVGQP